MVCMPHRITSFQKNNRIGITDAAKEKPYIFRIGDSTESACPDDGMSADQALSIVVHVEIGDSEHNKPHEMNLLYYTLAKRICQATRSNWNQKEGSRKS